MRTRPLTPYALRMIDRFGQTGTRPQVINRIERKLREENRSEATGHGVRDPHARAVEIVESYENATPGDIRRCRISLHKINRALGIQ